MSDTTDGALGRHALTAGLVGVAHGCSHFFQLVLPPLFPLLTVQFDLSYTELGAVMTTFFITSGLGQPVAGFLVDRFGARTILLSGLAIYSCSVLVLSVLPTFWLFFPVMAIAGLGNCVFHPCDFTLLNASVRESHLGRAFSVHTLGGNLGWALAPPFVLLLANVAGWRWALAAGAGMGAAVWLLLWANRSAFAEDGRERGPVVDAGGLSVSLRLLLSRPLMLCFTFFVLLAAALIAVQNFLPPILGALHTTSLVLAGTALTGFLLGASAGVISGGIVADRTRAHGGVVVAGLAGAAAMLMFVAHVHLAAALLVGTMTAAGFLSGLTTPSRDLLVRGATPKGATGRVFGFVYSGLDVGSALAPVTVGLLLDHGRALWALWAVAGLMLAAGFTVVSLRGTALLGARPLGSEH